MPTTRPELTTAVLVVPALLFGTIGLWMVVDPAGIPQAVGGFGTTSNTSSETWPPKLALALAGVLGVSADPGHGFLACRWGRLSAVGLAGLRLFE